MLVHLKSVVGHNLEQFLKDVLITPNKPEYECEKDKKALDIILR